MYKISARLQPLAALVRFNVSDHGSILGSPASVGATIEMQREVASFAASQGAQLTITDSSVIQPVPVDE